MAPRIELILGDITSQQVDVVVNAANEGLSGGGGVDGAIHRAAGTALQGACAELAGCATGDAKLTPGFDLPAGSIAHAGGPRYRGGNHGEAELLASCYRRCLALADSVGATSIAFPAISTGIYGYPKAEAARIAVVTLRTTPTQVALVRLVAFEKASYAALKDALEETLPTS